MTEQTIYNMAKLTNYVSHYEPDIKTLALNILKEIVESEIVFIDSLMENKTTIWVIKPPYPTGKRFILVVTSDNYTTLFTEDQYFSLFKDKTSDKISGLGLPTEI